MRRRALSFASALSFLLCITAAGMWVRSSLQFDVLAGFQAAGRYWEVCSGGRGLIITDVPEEFHGRPVRLGRWSFLGFGGVSMKFGTSRGGLLAVPYWFPTILFAALPLAWLLVRVERRGVPEGRCPACGYDLRATPDRCPECGTIARGPGKANA